MNLRRPTTSTCLSLLYVTSLNQVVSHDDRERLRKERERDKKNKGT
jgi:hypothetical protein